RDERAARAQQPADPAAAPERQPPLAARRAGVSHQVRSLAAMAECYRHPGRETNVSCSNCGRPICPDCMTVTPVGMRCPECARQRTRVTQGVAGLRAGASPATYALIAINVV